MDFILFSHKETGGEFQAPDEPGVREYYEARGWEEIDPPAPVPFVPEKVNVDPNEVPAEWVTLEHSETHARHDFPNNPEAIAGAEESGWERIPEPKEEPPAGDPEPPADVPDSKPPKAKAPAKAVTPEEK